jgi:aminocarboxymuconate-semialdehyde decarboxylase
MKIDIFNHIFPKKFFDKYIDAGHGGKDIGKRVSNIQTIVDVDSRMRILDEFGDYVQVLTLPRATADLCRPDKSPEIPREGNDGLAELS